MTRPNQQTDASDYERSDQQTLDRRSRALSSYDLLIFTVLSSLAFVLAKMTGVV